MKLIVANWKKNPVSVAEAVELAKATDLDGLVICPPFNFLKEVGDVLQMAKLGAQDLTLSAVELKKRGVEYVIIGHSDRRKEGETNEVVAEKMADAVAGGLIPIMCIGETLEQKNAGLKEKVVKEQFEIGLSKIPNLKSPIFVAYEPVWAISTNPNAQPDIPQNTLDVIDLLKKINLSPLIHFLYGGSVSPINADSFLRNEQIEGALVGRASLNKDEIKKICLIAENY